MIATVYINLEDDVAKIVARIKKVRGGEIVLVCPKRCFLFSDKVNLGLLKKQTDFLGKKISILTMDDKGQNFAKDAGFEIKPFPKSGFRPLAVSDIQINKLQKKDSEPMAGAPNQISKAVKEVSNFVSGLVAKKPESTENLLGQRSSLKLKPATKISNPITLTNGALATKPTKAKSSHLKIISFVALLSVILCLGLFFIVLPEAQVVIYPKSETLIRDFDISLDSSVATVDVAGLILPATKISENFTQTGKFQSQGKKDVGNKASGYVRIYNFTGQTLNLKAETTTLNASGKVYKLANDALQIKPVKYKNPKTKEIDESSLSEALAIIATAGGESYNLPAGLRLEISNTVFGSRPQLLYAKTDDPITGGYTRYLSVVSQEDVNFAREELGKEILNTLKQKISESGLELPDGGYRMEVLDYSTDKSINTESPSFNAKLAVKIVGVAFSKNNFIALVKGRLLQGLSENKDLDLENQTTMVKQFKNIDLNSFNANLSVHLETKIFSKLVLSEYYEKLKGKNIKSANEFLLADENLEKVEVTLLPAWQKTFPLIKSRIKIIINK